jgi:hypothetical protein
MADAHIERTGVTKAAGGLQREELAAQFLPTAVAVAELIDVVKRAMRRNRRRLEENGRKIADLAERSAVPGQPTVRGVTEIHQGLVDLDLQRFGVGLVDRQQAPKTANGHGSHGDGVGPSPAPQWHPESD